MFRMIGSLLCAGAFAAVAAATSASAQDTSQAAQEVPEYVGSQACVSCHEDAAENWEMSHHAQAWRMPGPDMLVGAFEGEVFEHDGMQATFTTEGDARIVTVLEKDGIERRYTVHSVGGVTPLEHLILETGKGRMQSFDVVWDVEQKAWFHLYPDQDLPPQDAYHWSGAYKNWNARCAECHATGFEKNYDFRTKRYASTQVEIGVGCEACHGPGAAHLEIVQEGTTPPGRYAIALNDWGFSAEMGDPQKAMEQCAGCHSRREAFGEGNPLPGTAFAEAYNLAMLRPGLYHADGQILDEVYVYGSFKQSKMHDAGVTCANCHEPHSSALVAEGNAICTQCHSEAGNPDFPTLRLAEYDSVAHTKHAEDSEGGQCVSCHMMDQVYMGNDWRRDHNFRVPRPDVSARLNTPDACTRCHSDEDSDWAAAQVAAWFPQGRWRTPHYGDVLARGRGNSQAAAGELMALAQDASQADMVRATALWLLGPGANALDLAELGAFLEDPDPQVRVGALDALKERAAVASAPYLIKGLNDEVRAVRIAAARAIMGQPASRMPDSLRPYVGQAYQEFGAMVRNQLDFAEAHLQVAGYSMVAGNIPAAIASLREAVRINPQNVQAWQSLVRLSAQTEGRAAAARHLRRALRYNPEDQVLQQMADQL
ncbi:HEAT repeat domain-containing protein [Shimia sp. R11_0]|uniref:multiheme c-type cytochrome n=1 Tax=Shimia sp. R11_0 TaxID=2821096 RepID=UPI001ADBE58D|nr:multiheme c-type cytochrome [Shimia sp. R11_0]MBO9478273.1 HEAT repeat domain-containing protein [Shimia sp. R11_0]